jgi:hypothetical protein
VGRRGFDLAGGEKNAGLINGSSARDPLSLVPVLPSLVPVLPSLVPVLPAILGNDLNARLAGSEVPDILQILIG